MLMNMCKKINRSLSLSWLVACMMIFLGAVCAHGNIPYVYSRGSQEVDVDEPEDPEIMFNILARLGQSILQANEMKKIENKKRGLDLGLNRSYSGSQQAKHMMGIAAASGGPGRRRRSQESYRQKLPY